MSAKRHGFVINRTTSAPASTLFRLETLGARWSEGAKPLAMQSSWEQEGDPAPAGPGAIRKIGCWPMYMREMTVDYEPDRRHTYTFVGFPLIKDYLGELLLTPRPSGGTDIRWSATFTEQVRGTGPILQIAFNGIVASLAWLLVRAAERESA